MLPKPVSRCIPCDTGSKRVRSGARHKLHANGPNRHMAGAVPPLVGVVGTVAGILFAFDRLGAEPEWKTVVEAVGFSLAVVGVSILVLMLAMRRR
jgi:biopolymer transport protein ExbB/TolQ